MRILAKTQFNIGDIVKFKGAATRFCIGGVIVETCPGGTQIHYNGLVLAPSFSARDGSAIAEKTTMVNECFLEKMPPAPPVIKGKDVDVKVPGYPLLRGETRFVKVGRVR